MGRDHRFRDNSSENRAAIARRIPAEPDIRTSRHDHFHVENDSNACRHGAQQWTARLNPMRAKQTKRHCQRSQISIPAAAAEKPKGIFFVNFAKLNLCRFRIENNRSGNISSIDFISTSITAIDFHCEIQEFDGTPQIFEFHSPARRTVPRRARRARSRKTARNGAKQLDSRVDRNRPRAGDARRMGRAGMPEWRIHRSFRWPRRGTSDQPPRSPRPRRPDLSATARGHCRRTRRRRRAVAFDARSRA